MGTAMAGKTTLSHSGSLCCGKEGCATRGLGWFLPDPVTTQSEQDPFGLTWKTGAQECLGQEPWGASVAGTVEMDGGVLSPHRGKGSSRGWEEVAGCIGTGDNAMTMSDHQHSWEPGSALGQTPLTVSVHEISPVWTPGFLQRTLRAFWEIKFLCQSCLSSYLIFPTWPLIGFFRRVATNLCIYTTYIYLTCET